MPIVGERSSNGTLLAQRRWLIIIGVTVALLLTLPLVPFLTPVTLHAGDAWLTVQTMRQDQSEAPSVYAVDVPEEPPSSPDLTTGARLQVVDYHGRTFSWNHWNYGVCWFRVRVVPEGRKG